MWNRTVQSIAEGAFLPFTESMFIDLAEDPDTAPSPIVLGFRLGRHRLLEELTAFAEAGVHHVAFNLSHSTRPVDEVMQELAEFVLPSFPSLLAPTMPPSETT